MAADGIERVGDTIRRPRGAGSEVVEALLGHLEAVGFDGAPRFLGIDADGRQVLSWVPGEATQDPPWLHDDVENARRLGEVAGLLRRVHDATAGFVPPPGAEPQRPLAVAGDQWSHADAHYGNTVYRDDLPVALIDWEFAAPGDARYDPIGLLICARLPRPDRPDEQTERERSAHRVLEAIMTGYGFTAEQAQGAPLVAAAFFDGAADYLVGLGETGVDGRTPESVAPVVAIRRSLADWWRTHSV